MSEGDEALPIARGPHSVSDRVAWLIAAVGERFFVSDRIYRFMNEHSGWGRWDPDWKVFRNFHDDMFEPEYPQSFGAQRTAWAAMAVTNWMGDAAILRTLHSEHRVAGGNGWIFWVRPRVTRKYRDGTHCCVDLDCSVTNQDGRTVTPAWATVILPSRELGEARYPSASLSS
ncbi:MAG: hypothetical protein JO247_14605 [Chloroflexi bacterium]|nr:hypothetical protein [Chloroflexota bacterium]